MVDDQVTVQEVARATAEVCEGIRALLPQLSGSAPPPSDDEIDQIASSPATTLFVARRPQSGHVVGSLTLAVFRIPTGMRAWIEDVVVDESERGTGVGAALTKAALDKAAALGCRTVDLTSRPTREAANRLYKRIGFTQRQTNVYRYEGNPEAAS
ncbi:MAG: GNAT family N-acetyltransferase [Acidimicrobiales bacterium]